MVGEGNKICQRVIVYQAAILITFSDYQSHLTHIPIEFRSASPRSISAADLRSSDQTGPLRPILWPASDNFARMV